MSKEVAKRPGARCIGEETEKAIKREKLSCTPLTLNEYRSGTPLGEVHLQVSLIFYSHVIKQLRFRDLGRV